MDAGPRRKPQSPNFLGTITGFLQSGSVEKSWGQTEGQAENVCIYMQKSLKGRNSNWPLKFRYKYLLLVFTTPVVTVQFHNGTMQQWPKKTPQSLLSVTQMQCISCGSKSLSLASFSFNVTQWHCNLIKH